ncbi:MAG TPA: 50S ribosomal protein L21 [Ktedonobacteraceae bacterium]|jgi:large subunit ribosomal protein L21
MFAVIKSGGRQYKVAVGEELQVNRLLIDHQMVEDGEQVRFEEVLLISDAENTMVGTPLVSNALVLATAVRQGRGEKLIVFKYKSKKRYRHKRGHRQELTFLTIDDIVANGKSLITGEAPLFREKEVPSAEISEVETTEAETSTDAEAAPSTEVASASEPEKKTRRRRSTKADEGE